MQTPMLLESQGTLSNLSLAYLLLRATLGLNILIHGVTRLLSGPRQFATFLVHAFQATPLPPSLVTTFGYSLPWIEALLGLLLLVGLFTRPALIGGTLLILLLTFGTTLRQDWETAGLQLIYAVIYTLLLALHAGNRYSLDPVLRRS